MLHVPFIKSRLHRPTTNNYTFALKDVLFACNYCWKLKHVDGVIVQQATNKYLPYTYKTLCPRKQVVRQTICALDFLHYITHRGMLKGHQDHSNYSHQNLHVGNSMNDSDMAKSIFSTESCIAFQFTNSSFTQEIICLVYARLENARVNKAWLLPTVSIR